MAVQAYVDSFALDTTTGSKTQSPGSLTFKPNGIFVANNHATADGLVDDTRRCIGVANATGQRYVVFEDEDNVATSACGSAQLANGLWSGMIDAAAVDHVSDFTSFNAGPNGFTYNQSNAPAAADIMNYVLLGGDVTIEPFVLNLGSTTGPVSLATLSGRPDCVIFFTAAAITAADTAAAGATSIVPTLGWMCANGTQGVAGVRVTNASATSDSARWSSNARCIDLRTTAANLVSATLDHMDANGFTLNVTVTSINIRVFGFAIYGGKWTAGSYTGSGSAGVQTNVNTRGVQPKILFLQTVGNAAGGSTTVHGSHGMGCTDGTRSWAVGLSDPDNDDPTNTASYLDRTKALVHVGQLAGAPQLNDTYTVTLGADSFTSERAVSSGGTYEILYLAGGEDLKAFDNGWAE